MSLNTQSVSHLESMPGISQSGIDPASSSRVDSSRVPAPGVADSESSFEFKNSSIEGPDASHLQLYLRIL